MGIKQNLSILVALVFSTLVLSGCLGSATLDAECQANTDCDASWGEYCYLPQDCDPVAITGQCKLKPTQSQCSQLPEYPVCGCNQQEYRNLCWAAQARQSVVYFGVCRAHDQPQDPNTIATLSKLLMGLSSTGQKND